MDRFDAMRVFVRIVELSSFSKAADDLQLPRASVTHTIQQLEKRLGVRLLQRTTRVVSATADGEAYFQRCQRLLADLEEAESAFHQSALQPRGKLRVDLQGTFSRHFVMPYLGEFMDRYPGMALEIGVGDRLVDLVREGVDCVLRSGEPKDSSMVARRMAQLQQVTCASAGYVARHGLPRSLDELKNHSAVNYLGSSGKVLPFEFVVDGELRHVQLRGRVTVNQAEAYVNCCEAGLGVVQVPRYHIEDRLADGRLCLVLPGLPPPPMTVSVMYPHHRQLSPRVRVFVDWLAQRLQQAA